MAGRARRRSLLQWCTCPVWPVVLLCIYALRVPTGATAATSCSNSTTADTSNSATAATSNSATAVTSSSATPAVGLDYLLWPLDATTFWNHYFERSPVLLHRGSEGWSRLGLDLSSVDLLLQHQAAARAENLHKLGSQWDCSQVMADESNAAGSVFEGYLAGRTIVCPLVSHYWAPTAQVLLEATAQTRLQWGANLYLTPRSSQGFSLHTDCTDAIMTQLAGSKMWHVYNSSFALPLRSQEAGAGAKVAAEPLKGELLLNDTLSQGSLLTVPRGMLHAGYTGPSNASIHLTFATGMLRSPNWVNFLSRLFEQISHGAPPLPPDVAKFIEQVLTVAVRAKAAEQAHGWLRRSMPHPYLNPRGRLRKKVVSEYAVILAQLKRVLLADPQLRGPLAHPARRASFDEAFDVLLDTRSRLWKRASKAVVAHLQEQVESTKAQLTHSKRYFDPGKRYHGRRLVDKDTLVKLSTQLQLGSRNNGQIMVHNGRHTCHPREAATITVRVRWTQVMANMLRWLVQQHRPFKVQDMPSNDAFEKIALAHVLLSRRLLTLSLDHELNSIASLHRHN